MKQYVFLLIAAMGLMVETKAMNIEKKGPQFKITLDEKGQRQVQVVDSGKPGQSIEATPPPYGPNPGDFEKWVKEKEAEVERQTKIARREKEKAKRQELWYQLPEGTVTVKISGGSGKYRYILKKSKGGLLSDETDDRVQNSPIFKNVTAGSYTITVIDTETGCEAPFDFAISRESWTSTIAQFKNLPARC